MISDTIVTAHPGQQTASVSLFRSLIHPFEYGSPASNAQAHLKGKGRGEQGWQDFGTLLTTAGTTSGRIWLVRAGPASDEVYRQAPVTATAVEEAGEGEVEGGDEASCIHAS